MVNKKVLVIPERRISAKRVILTSLIVDVIDIILNLSAAVISGSVILVSETLEGLADFAASVSLLIGYERSKKEPDHTHPFGYGREIYFWTLISALVMFGITATFSVYLGWQRFLHPEPIKNLNLAMFVLAVAFLTNGYAFVLSLVRLLKSRSLINIGKIFFRSSLVETKTTFILDLMGTIASVLGLISLHIYRVTKDLRYDGLGAMVIGIVLAILSYYLILSIRDLLIGRSASKEVEDRIKKTTFSVPEVRDVLDLKTMHIGSEKLLVNMEVHLEDELTTDQIEVLIDKIKSRIQQEIPAVKHIQVELETPN